MSGRGNGAERCLSGLGFALFATRLPPCFFLRSTQFVTSALSTRHDGMTEQLTEKEAKRYSRQRRDTNFELPDGSFYRNGIKISAEDRRRSEESRERDAAEAARSASTGRIGSDAAAKSPASAFRTSPSLDAYAGERARQLDRENDAADRRQDSPASLAAAAERDRTAVASRDVRLTRFADTAAAMRDGKPMPAGVSVSMGGDPDAQVDAPSGSISRYFKDGTGYTLTGRTRAERIADAQKQGIYERLLAENPGANDESRAMEDSRMKAGVRNVLAGGTAPGITRTADGGIAVNGAQVEAARVADVFRPEARRADDFYQQLMAENERRPESPRAPAASSVAPVAAPATAPLAPAYTLKGAGQRGLGAAAWLASDPSAANPANFLETAERYGRAGVRAAWDGTWEVPEKGLIRQTVEAVQERNPFVRGVGNIIGDVSAAQQQKAAQTAGFRPDAAALRRAAEMARRIRSGEPAPTPVSYVGPAPIEQATPVSYVGPASSEPLTPVSYIGPAPVPLAPMPDAPPGAPAAASPGALFRVAPPAPPATAAPYELPAGVSAEEMIRERQLRQEAAAQGTPVSSRPADAFRFQPTGSLAMRRRPPLITAFRSGTAAA